MNDDVTVKVNVKNLGNNSEIDNIKLLSIFNM